MGKKKASAKKSPRTKKTAGRKPAQRAVKKKAPKKKTSTAKKKSPARKKAPARKNSAARKRTPARKKSVSRKKTAAKTKKVVTKKTSRATRKPRPRKTGAKVARKPVKKTTTRKKPAAKSAVKRPAAKPTKKKPAKSTATKSPTQKKAGTVRRAKAPAAAMATAAQAPKTKGRSRQKKASQNMSEQVRKQLVARARSRTKTQRAAAFTLDDVLGEIARTGSARKERSPVGKGRSKAGAKAAEAPVARAPVVEMPPPKQQKYGAASLADILGYNPAANEQPEDEKTRIPRKYQRYYKLLVELRDHVKSGLAVHTEDTLKRSNREDSGDLSGYGQHMADAGTDAFDRDFALSLVSSEQEALYEIEEAIKRIKKGTYGTCELTGKQIDKERLLAVPFARYSVESQAEIEKVRRHTAQRAGVFADATGEDGKFLEDDSD